MWCKQMIYFPGLCEKWLLARAFSVLFNSCPCLHAAWEFMPMALVRNKAFLFIFFLLWHLCPLTCFTEAVTSSLPKQQRKPLPAMGACGASVGVEKGTQPSFGLIWVILLCLTAQQLSLFLWEQETSSWAEGTNPDHEEEEGEESMLPTQRRWTLQCAHSLSSLAGCFDIWQQKPSPWLD